LGTTAALGTTSPPTAAIASPQPASSTIDEENKFLLKNLQLSKTASSRDNSMANRLVTNPAHQQNRRILMIAGAVALAILVIIGLATALNVFDFIREARQIPLGRIPGSPFIL
jgi:hypothetical protein